MIPVVAAILTNAHGEILLARRALHKSQPGKWEFPGGKVDAGETPEDALERELLEEFRIRTETGACIGESEYAYPHLTIRLIAYRSRLLGGEFHLTDHDRIAWVAPRALTSYDLAPADIPLIPQILATLK